MAGLYDRWMVNNLRNCQSVYHSGCTIFHSQEQGRRALIGTHSCQNLPFPVFLILVILVVHSSSSLEFLSYFHSSSWERKLIIYTTIVMFKLSEILIPVQEIARRQNTLLKCPSKLLSPYDTRFWNPKDALIFNAFLFWTLQYYILNIL